MATTPMAFPQIAAAVMLLLADNNGSEKLTLPAGLNANFSNADIQTLQTVLDRVNQNMGLTGATTSTSLSKAVLALRENNRSMMNILAGTTALDWTDNCDPSPAQLVKIARLA